MFERFTSPAREAVVKAGAAARDLRHNYIGTEHLLLGLGLTEQSVAERVLRGLGVDAGSIRSGIVRVVGEGPTSSIRTGDAEALRSIGIDIDEIRRRTEDAFGPGALDRPLPVRRWSLRGRRISRCIPTSGHIPFTCRAKKVMELSLREALRLGHKYIGTEPWFGRGRPGCLPARTKRGLRGAGEERRPRCATGTEHLWSVSRGRLKSPLRSRPRRPTHLSRSGRVTTHG
jgi:hypothetical protein